MTLKIRVGLPFLVAAVVLSACGGGGGATSTEASEPSGEATAAQDTASSDATPSAGPTKDEFIAAAVEECKTVNQATSEVQPQGDPFGKDATDEDREQAVTFLQTFADALKTFVANLRAFGIPEEDADAAEQLLTAGDAAAAAFQEAADAAREDFAKAEAAVGEAFGSVQPMEEAAAEYGIGSLQNCGEEEPAEEPDPDATEVTVTPVGEDGTYDWEIEPVRAGKTAFVMDNTDDEAHLMFIVQLKEKGDLAKALEAEQGGDSEAAQQLAKGVAESNTAQPGQTAVVNAQLGPGLYGMLCFIPGPEGAPHAADGMAVEFEVE